MATTFKKPEENISLDEKRKQFKLPDDIALDSVQKRLAQFMVDTIIGLRDTLRECADLIESDDKLENYDDPDNLFFLLGKTMAGAMMGITHLPKEVPRNTMSTLTCLMIAGTIEGFLSPQSEDSRQKVDHIIKNNPEMRVINWDDEERRKVLELLKVAAGPGTPWAHLSPGEDEQVPTFSSFSSEVRKKVLH